MQSNILTKNKNFKNIILFRKLNIKKKKKKILSTHASMGNIIFRILQVLASFASFESLAEEYKLGHLTYKNHMFLIYKMI
jgi:hypothetical protein